MESCPGGRGRNGQRFGLWAAGHLQTILRAWMCDCKPAGDGWHLAVARSFAPAVAYPAFATPPASR